MTDQPESLLEEWPQVIEPTFLALYYYHYFVVVYYTMHLSSFLCFIDGHFGYLLDLNDLDKMIMFCAHVTYGKGETLIFEVRGQWSRSP